MEKELINYIVNSTRKNEILKKTFVRRILINCIDELLFEIDESYYKYILDSDFAILISNSNDVIKILNKLVYFNNEFVKKIMTDKNIIKAIDAIIDENSRFNLSIETLETYLNYLFDNKKYDRIYFLISNPKTVSINRILNTKENIDRLIKNNLIDEKNILCLDTCTLEKIINYDYIKKIIINSNIIKELIIRKIVIPDDVIENKHIIKYICNIDNVDEYRFIINLLEYRQKNYQIEEIEKRREIYYENLLESYDFKSKMFAKYKDLFKSLVDELDKEKLTDAYYLLKNKLFGLSNSLTHDILLIFYDKKSNKEKKKNNLNILLKNISVKEYICTFADYKFKDVTYNLFLNLNQVIKFYEKGFVASEYMIFYKKLYDCYKNNYLDINFYGFFKDRDLVKTFYDDYRKSKNNSYDMIKKSLYKFDDRDIDVDLSKKYGCNVYDFNGNPFYLLIHNTGVRRECTVDQIFNGSIYDSTSLSLISDNRLKYYNDYSKSIVLGFNNIDIRNIVHVYESDSYSSFVKNNEEMLASERVNKLYTPYDLIKETRGYNEIVYQCHQNNTNENYLKNILVPSYVLVFDKLITDLDVKVSKKYNIPIININKSKYNTYKKTVIDVLGNSDSYVTEYDTVKKLIK